MASPESTSKLNLFKFVSKRKHSEASASSAQSAGPTAVSNSNTTNTSKEFHSDIDTSEKDDSFPPESFYNQDGDLVQSPLLQHSPSEASLIFERNVEDPAPVFNTCPRCGSKSSNGQLKCSHQSIVNLPSHYSTENFISPCLDATTQILTDKTTDLDNVDMVYSRRPSTVMGLEMALGRTRSYSTATSNFNSPTSPKAQRTQSFANVQELDSNPSRPPILSFYSYADVINNENPNPRRPSISQSLSSSFLNNPTSRSNSISQNNFGNSITPRRTQSRQSFSSPFVAIQQQRVPRDPKKFSLNPDNSPNSSDSESDFNPLKQSLSSRHSISSKKSSSSRRKATLPNINTNITPLNRTYSDQSSFVSNNTNGSGRRYSNLNDVDGASDSESFVVSSIGDELRRNTGEIKSN